MNSFFAQSQVAHFVRNHWLTFTGISGSLSSGISMRDAADGSTFVSLELTGDIELVQSANTGRFYATVRRCFISSTFDEATAQRMVGRQLPGNIVKVPCEEYDFAVPDTGEVIQLAHRYDYVPEKHVAAEPMVRTASFDEM